MLMASTSVTEVTVIFLQLMLFANTAAFFYYLFGLDSHYFWEGDSGEEISTIWHWVEEINHPHISWFVSRNNGLQTSFSC